MNRYIIGSLWDRDNRNGVNKNFEYLFEGRLRVDFLNNRADSILNEAKQTNDMNKNVQEQINTLVAESGTSDAEVLQARTDVNGIAHPVLNERLNNSEDKLENTERVINVRNHGAKGDGVTDDWAAIQSCIALAYTLNRPVYIPSGKYYVSKTLRTNHSRTYNYSYGIKIFGNGKDSQITGNNKRIAADYDNELSTQSLFSVHGSNNIIENLSFYGGEIGLYLGQDPRETELGSISFNNIMNVWFEYNGTSLALQHGSGVHYNKFRNVHGVHSQIGIHLVRGQVVDRVNNNRNVFDGIRMSRMWLGIFVEDGDGNMFDNTFTETISGSQAIGSAPQILIEKTDGKATSLVMAGQYNIINNYASEAIEWDLLNTGFRNIYTNLMIKDDTDAKITLETIPLSYEGNSKIGHAIRYQPSAGALYQGPAGISLTHTMHDLNNGNAHNIKTVDLVDLSDNIIDKHNYSSSMYKRMALVVEWATNYRFTVDGNKLNEPIRIKLPDNDAKRLAFPYKADLSFNNTMPFEVFYGTSATMPTKIRGRYSSDSESTEFGDDHIIIEAPQNGWDARSQVNYMSFNISYMRLW